MPRDFSLSLASRNKERSFFFKSAVKSNKLRLSEKYDKQQAISSQQQAASNKQQAKSNKLRLSENYDKQQVTAASNKQ